MDSWILTLAMLLVLALSGPAFCEPADCPLEGTWKSDASMTLADIAANNAMSPRAMGALSDDFFGHMIHEWTCTELRAGFDRDPRPDPVAYRVTERTSESLLVTFLGEEESELRLVWEGSCYKIRFAARQFHEYFCPTVLR
jgi:hypothetical protein